MRVLLTGMSGAGKSALVRELKRRGHAAHDADDGEVEPLLRRSADLVLTTTAPPSQLADELLRWMPEPGPAPA